MHKLRSNFIYLTVFSGNKTVSGLVRILRLLLLRRPSWRILSHVDVSDRRAQSKVFLSGLSPKKTQGTIRPVPIPGA
ncbi:hypothetical protein AcV7_004701 [Taiwanofungus camphoratus]|nr:hypothetical protein AcV7_004701 [Antrodia cinnamomea]